MDEVLVVFFKGEKVVIIKFGLRLKFKKMDKFIMFGFVLELLKFLIIEIYFFFFIILYFVMNLLVLVIEFVGLFKGIY